MEVFQVPPVTRLSRKDLREFAQIFVLANTPISLFKGLTRCNAMDKLRKCPANELVEYYDYVTARARRSEIVVALMYAVLFAILLLARGANPFPVDVKRLLWGERVREYLKRSTVGTTSVIVLPTDPVTRVVGSSSVSSAIGGLLGPDGRPLVRRHE
jgi:hypothetical protein